MEDTTMKTMVRNFLTPTRENDMLPRVLDAWSFVVLVVTGLFLIISPVYMHNRELASLAAPAHFNPLDVIQLVNASRAQNALPALSVNPVLQNVAEAKAQDMIQKGYFAHVSPDQKTPWDFLKSGGYTYLAAGENLAIDFPTADDAHQALMASPTHRANILGNRYTEIGVAVEEGTYEGHSGIFLVEYFGTPRIAKALSVPTTPKMTPVDAHTSPAKPLPIAAPISPAPHATLAASPKPVSTEKPTSSPAANPAPHTVLGIESPAPTPSADQNRINLFIKCFAYGIIALLCMALTFMITRGPNLRFGMLSRLVIIFVIFGYLAIYGPRIQSTASVTPTSFSTVSIETTR